MEQFRNKVERLNSPELTWDFVRTTFPLDIQRMCKHPWHPECGIQAVFERLSQLPAQDRAMRTKMLEKEFAKWQQYRIRADSGFCSDFIDKRTLATAQEVAATMTITEELLDSYGARAWSKMSTTMEDTMHIHHFEKGCSWSDACHNVLNNGNFQRRALAILREGYTAH